jgi:hypothetical protein
MLPEVSQLCQPRDVIGAFPISGGLTQLAPSNKMNDSLGDFSVPVMNELMQKLAELPSEDWVLLQLDTRDCMPEDTGRTELVLTIVDNTVYSIGRKS